MTPLVGTNRVTSIMGNRTNPITGKNEFHAGQDIGAPTGTNVRCVTKGTVTAVNTGYQGGRGNNVVLQTAPGVTNRYQHLNTINVKKGQTIAQGVSIGTVGSTGDSTGPHLHFEVVKNGKVVDPSPWSDVPNKKGSWPGNNTIDKAISTPKKTNEQIAAEVIAGKWGNGDERKKRLAAAGYSYDAVQAIVNKKTGSGSTSTITNRYAKGRAVKLSNVTLYASATAKSGSKVSGTYYLYDGKSVSGRYRITNSSARVGKTPIGQNVTGFIASSSVPK